jgi:hypothetical protein
MIGIYIGQIGKGICRGDVDETTHHNIRIVSSWFPADAVHFVI